MAAFPASGFLLRPAGHPPSVPPRQDIISTARRPTSLPNGAAPASFLHARRPYCRRDCLPTPRPAAASPRVARHSRHAAAATPTAPLPTTSLLAQHASPTPFTTEYATAPPARLPAWPPPPSSLSPASEGSTAVGLAEALPSPASRTAVVGWYIPCVQFVRRLHPRQFTMEARGIPQGGAILPSPASSTSGGHIAQSGGPLAEPAEFTAATTGSPSTERITPSNTRFFLDYGLLAAMLERPSSLAPPSCNHCARLGNSLSLQRAVVQSTSKVQFYDRSPPLATRKSIAGSHGKSINAVCNVRQGTKPSGVHFS